jgi:hypothetical protein
MRTVRMRGVVGVVPGVTSRTEVKRTWFEAVIEDGSFWAKKKPPRGAACRLGSEEGFSYPAGEQGRG